MQREMQNIQIVLEFDVPVDYLFFQCPQFAIVPPPPPPHSLMNSLTPNCCITRMSVVTSACHFACMKTNIHSSDLHIHTFRAQGYGESEDILL